MPASNNFLTTLVHNNNLQQLENEHLIIENEHQTTEQLIINRLRRLSNPKAFFTPCNED